MAPKDRLQVLRPDPPPEPTPQQRATKARQAYADGLALVRQGDYAGALGAFEDCLHYNPNCVDALLNYGACHEILGDPFLAINIYKRVLEMTPNDPVVYVNLGTCYIKMYHREKSPAWREMARSAWRRSLELKPNQPDVRRYLVEAGIQR